VEDPIQKKRIKKSIQVEGRRRGKGRGNSKEETSSKVKKKEIIEYTLFILELKSA
jgi:hypothetical protein